MHIYQLLFYLIMPLVKNMFALGGRSVFSSPRRTDVSIRHFCFRAVRDLAEVGETADINKTKIEENKRW